MSLLELRSAGSHRGLSFRWSLAYSSCWAGFSFSTSCFNYSIHPIIIYTLYHSLIRSTAPLIGTEGGDSCRNSTCLKTPESGFLEEAEAVPAESVRLQWKSTVFNTLLGCSTSIRRFNQC